MKKQLVIEWERELGWKINPFLTNIPHPVAYFMSGFVRVRELLNLFVLNKKQFCTICGEDGEGKTMMLSWLEDQLRNFPKIHVVRLQSKDFHSMSTFLDALQKPFWKSPLMKGYKQFMERVKKVKITRQNIISFIKQKTTNERLFILMDEPELKLEHHQLVQQLFDLPNITIVIAGTGMDLKKYKFDLKKKTKILLPKMTNDELFAMVAKRIASVGGSDIWPFEKSQLMKIIHRSKGNPEKVLVFCEDLAKKLAIEVRNGIIKRPVVEAVPGQPEKKGFSININLGDGLSSDTDSEEKQDTEEYEPVVEERPPVQVAHEVQEPDTAKAQDEPVVDEVHEEYPDPEIAEIIVPKEEKMVVEDKPKKKRDSKTALDNEKLIDSITKSFRKH